MHIQFTGLYKLLALALLSLWTLRSQAQGVSSFSADVHLNSRGFGLQFNYLVPQSNTFSKKIITQFSSVKDPKEITITNLTLSNPDINNGGYEFGKINSMYAMRFGMGFEKPLAARPDKNAVGVIYSASAGLNLAVQSPTFIDYYDPSQVEKQFVTERYNPEIHQRQNIIQSRGFFYGLKSAHILPGLFIDQSFVYEFGKYSYLPNRITTGVLIDAHFIRPELLYQNKHPSVFLTFYISFAILNLEV